MSKVFNELKRRNVFRVAGIYSVTGWLLLQMAVALEMALGLPDWFDTFILAMLIIGFPLALFFAWAYEITPDGLKPTGEVDEEVSIRHETGRKLNYFLGATLIAVLGFIAYQNLGSGPEPVKVAAIEKSIAVLPFVNMSNDPAQDYFADGISEDLLNALVKLPGLKVTGRTSSFQFKGQNRDLRLIGRQLNVTTILEGSVRKSGSRVRITAQLINVEDGFHLWSQTYDRELTDIFAVQDEISKAIVEALRMTLADEDSELVTAGTSNLQAYDFYLRGRHEFALRNIDGFKPAVEFLKEAVRLDPNYADAWGTLGTVYSLAAQYDLEEAHEDNWVEKSRQAIRRALTLNPDNVKALVASGFRNHYDWNWDAAERDFKRALALSPNDAEATNLFGDHLRNAMDFERAIAMETRAAELDPLFHISWFDLGFTQVKSGRVEEGLATIELGRALRPNSVTNYRFSLRVLVALGRLEEAALWLEEAKLFFPDLATVFYYGALIPILQGETERADALIETYLAIEDIGKSNPLGIATLFYQSGRADEGLAWLENAYDSRNSGFVFPRFLGDPRDPFIHPSVAEIFERPGLKEIMDARRRNLGLEVERPSAQ